MFLIRLTLHLRELVSEGKNIGPLSFLSLVLKSYLMMIFLDF